MFPTKFTNFKIKLKDKLFITSDNNKYSQTVAISFYNEYNHEISYVELGYLPIEEIYKKINHNEPLNLNETFIENFSILDYKKKYGINENENVEIKEFSASNAIFYSNSQTSFENVIFKGKPVFFEKSLFIKGTVNFENVVFEEGNVNFNSVIFFNGNVSFYNANFVKGNINFKNTTWGAGLKNFQYAFWGNGNVMFANSTFANGNISFVNCSFGDGELSFKICEFGSGNIDFRFAVFGNTHLTFEKAKLSDGLVDFGKTEFGNAKINFNKAIFGKSELSFDETEIVNGKLLFKQLYFEEGNVHFDEANMPNSNLNFSRSIFKQVHISFYKAKLQELSFKACQLNSYCDLRLSHCETLDLSEAFIRDIVDISSEENPHAVSALNIFGTRLIGRIYLEWKINNVYGMIQQNKGGHYEKAWQYNLLKQNFNELGQYNDEDAAYVAFKREELALKKEQLKNKHWFKRILHHFILEFQKLVFDKIGLYATSPLRVFYSIIVIWFIFGLIFVILDFLNLGKTWSSVGNPDNISIIAQTFYHSAITFFTIGYGDVFPLGISRLISAIEGFVGVFMMSYFTVAFVRKVLR